jgi:beta-barrel assembly-enhancing protease
MIDRMPIFSLAMAALLLMASPQAQPQMRSGGLDNLPVLGEASVDELSPAAEQRLGDQIYQEFLRAGVIHDDPETTDYLTRQATKLLHAATQLNHTEADRSFLFFVVKDPTLNAFALPGGYIGVHTGLLVASPRESEVMSVLAHEIGHVTQRHIARMFGQQRKSSAVMIAAALLAAIAAQSSPDAAMGLLSLGQTMAIRDQLSFSRDAEREADRVGLQILSVSGFDPAGMSSMFERLGQAGRLYDNNAPAYLRTHPLSTERIADIQNRLQTDPDLRRLQKNSAGHSSTHAGMQAGLKNAGGPESVQFSWLRAKLIALTDTKVDGLRAARTRFEAQLKDPTQNTAGHQGPIQFGIAWAALLQRDFKGALTAIEAASALAENAGAAQELAPLIINFKLQLAIAANQEPAAKALVQMVQNNQAWANERAVVRSSIQAQLAFGMPAETAAAMARKASQQWPQDPQVWSLLGRAEAARGRLAAQHAAVAEQYAISGAYAAAVEQLTLARAAGDADFITLSKIDARLTAMRAELRREQIERQQQKLTK